MSITALNTGINGINQGLSNMRRDASAIAQAINGSTAGNTSSVGLERPVDVAASLANLKLDVLQIQASGKVVESVSTIIGSLLDVTA